MTNPEDSNKSERSEAPKPRTLPLILVLHQQRTVALVVGWANKSRVLVVSQKVLRFDGQLHDLSV